jgi:hypothetical protein
MQAMKQQMDRDNAERHEVIEEVCAGLGFAVRGCTPCQTPSRDRRS